MTWLSVVTVVKDDPDGLARTLASLVGQDLAGVELVVVDGSDDAAAVPSMLADRASDVTVTYAYQAPRGIYAAMNEGLALASGKYVLYLNAGDELFDDAVLGRLRSALCAEPVWAFGPVEIVEDANRRVITPAWDYVRERAAMFSRGHFPAHQGTVASSEALRRAGGFDTSYRIAADYAMALRLSQMGDPMELPFVVSRFHEGGASTVGWREALDDFHRARVEILRPQGTATVRERWETLRRRGLMYAAREVRPRLSWAVRR